jgi:hypothetical protein
MVIFAALVLAAQPAGQLPPPAAAQRQAAAMVRILPGAAIKFRELEKSAAYRFTNARIRGSDGSSQPARLVEFQ